MNTNDPNWEKNLVTKLAEASIKEQRRSRRWGILFKLLTFTYIGVFIYLSSGIDVALVSDQKSHTALIELKGLIADEEAASADNLVTALRSAFENKHVKGIVIRANSPGGSPVQSGYVYDEIIRLKELHPDTPVYVVISDVCASGCYYIASAADKIYADKASIVGSIGVRMDNFGFVDAMQKLGIERRTLTAGKNKALLDPFLPIDETARSHMQTMLAEIHKQFINSVKTGRGDKLDTSIEGLFSGLIWTGKRAVEIGLVDGLGTASYVAREIIGEEDFVDYTPQDDLFERFASKMGASMALVLGQQLKPQISLPMAQ